MLEVSPLTKHKFYCYGPKGSPLHHCTLTSRKCRMDSTEKRKQRYAKEQKKGTRKKNRGKGQEFGVAIGFPCRTPYTHPPEVGVNVGRQNVLFWKPPSVVTCAQGWLYCILCSDNPNCRCAVCSCVTPLVLLRKGDASLSQAFDWLGDSSQTIHQSLLALRFQSWKIVNASIAKSI